MTICPLVIKSNWSLPTLFSIQSPNIRKLRVLVLVRNTCMTYRLWVLVRTTSLALTSTDNLGYGQDIEISHYFIC